MKTDERWMERVPVYEQVKAEKDLSLFLLSGQVAVDDHTSTSAYYTTAFSLI